MNWIITCTHIALAIYVIYNASVLLLFNVPTSLSNSYYLFKSKKSWLRWLFPIMMVSMAFLLMPAWIEISEGSNFQFLAFLAPAGIIFTGAAPAFKNSELEGTVHETSAIVAAICSILWVILVSGSWYLIIMWGLLIVVAAIITKTLKSCLIYWLETIAFLSTFCSIISYCQ